MKLLLDTSVIIDFLRRKDKANSLLYKLSSNDLYISIITHTELYSGKSVWESGIAKIELEEIFSGIMMLPLTVEISEQAGMIKAESQNLSLLDGIIAATAFYHGLELVTLNVKDFKVIKGVKIYSNI